MISAKLITNRGNFEINLLGSPSKEAALEHIQKTIAATGVFYGDHDILFLAPDVIVSVIEISETVKVEPTYTDDAPAWTEPAETMGLVYGAKHIKMLGQQLNIAYAAYNVPGHTYLIVTAINEDNPFDSLGLSNLIAVTREVAATEYKALCTAVTPPAQLLNEEEYVEYLKDYVKEIIATKLNMEGHGSNSGDAKAWQGWKEGGDNE